MKSFFPVLVKNGHMETVKIDAEQIVFIKRGTCSANS